MSAKFRPVCGGQSRRSIRLGSIRKNDSMRDDVITSLLRVLRVGLGLGLGLGLRAIRNKDAITSSRMESFFRIDPPTV